MWTATGNGANWRFWPARNHPEGGATPNFHSAFINFATFIRYSVYCGALLPVVKSTDRPEGRTEPKQAEVGPCLKSS